MRWKVFRGFGVLFFVTIVLVRVLFLPRIMTANIALGIHEARLVTVHLFLVGLLLGSVLVTRIARQPAKIVAINSKQTECRNYVAL